MAVSMYPGLKSSVFEKTRVRVHIALTSFKYFMEVSIAKRPFEHILPWPKKGTILEIRGEKNAVPRVISCSIRRDQRRAKVADSRGSDLPCADRA